MCQSIQKDDGEGRERKREGEQEGRREEGTGTIDLGWGHCNYWNIYVDILAQVSVRNKVSSHLFKQNSLPHTILGGNGNLLSDTKLSRG